VAISDPSDREHPVGFVQLRDSALSTSGASEKFVVVDGRRYSHLFDPRAGAPVEGMCQVTVVAASATDSDALTKAPFVLSREDTLRLFEKDKVVHVLRMEGPCGPGRVVWTTPWSSSVFVDAGAGR
jgi:thiamine biosynthesis lipoprotein